MNVRLLLAVALLASFIHATVTVIAVDTSNPAFFDNATFNVWAAFWNSTKANQTQANSIQSSMLNTTDAAGINLSVSRKVENATFSDIHVVKANLTSGFLQGARVNLTNGTNSDGSAFCFDNGNCTVQSILAATNFTGNGALGVFQGSSTNPMPGRLVSGSLLGYDAANAICAGNFSGSHFCTDAEIIYSTNVIYTKAGFTQNSTWVAKGAPGYTANSNDCNGWTNNTVTFLGAFWDWNATTGGGAGFVTACNGVKSVACCK